MGVGKTTILNNFISDGSTAPAKATVGSDFKQKEVQVGNTAVTLQIWDTAGQEQFNSLGFAFYRGANVCLLAYDVANKASFEALGKWKKNFLEHASPADPEKFPFIVVANKTDLAERVIDTATGDAWARDNGGLAYAETSAKEGTGVVAAFTKMAELSQASLATQDTYQMPTSLSGAAGAIKLDPKEDARRTETAK